ncbi:unnamed protein product [Lactuca saligna]|uniref:Uncharacterized protein n=1 Tax=Lactuca saligna TaxID=75948 RepID=A0AA36EDM3_LACSI|nr:unnamed protein product [Lactuca saligna]
MLSCSSSHTPDFVFFISDNIKNVCCFSLMIWICSYRQTSPKNQITSLDVEDDETLIYLVKSDVFMVLMDLMYVVHTKCLMKCLNEIQACWYQWLLVVMVDSSVW